MSDPQMSAGSARAYLTGFFAALVLTAIPFALVQLDVLSAGVTIAVVAVAALLQIAVQLRFFLHLSLRETPRANLVALAFAAILIFLMVGGSLWIMFDLRGRMAM